MIANGTCCDHSVRLKSTPVPGRLRLSVDGLRGQPAAEREIGAKLASLPQVHSVEPSALTGNVLVTFDPRRWTNEELLAASGNALGLPAEAPDAVLKPTVEIRTELPGRVRLVVPGLRRVPEREGPIQEHVRRIPGVQLVRANAWTGSVLVLFDPAACSVEQLVAACTEAGERPVSTIPRRSAVGRRARPAESAINWHALEVPMVARRLAVDPENGLTSIEAERRRRQVGPNLMPEPSEPSLLGLVVGQVLNVPTALLVAAAGISVATGVLLEAGLIMAVLGANVAIGTATERTGHRAIAALRRSTAIRARVRREGVERTLEADELVPGDVIQLLPGDPVPADARVIESSHLQVEESALTGESRPARKSPAAVDPRVPLADRRSMVYRGTTVVGGRGQAIVVATGEGTAIGQLHLLAAEAQAPPTPLEHDLDRLGEWLAIGASVACAAVVGLGVLRRGALRSSLLVAVSLGAAAIPEGLTALATSVLALASGRMRRKGTLIRTLGAAEALGSVTVVCADKTGTLTENRMAAHELYVGGRTLRITGPARARDGHFEWDGQPIDAAADSVLQRALLVGVLNSDAEITPTPTGAIEVDGSSTEGALQIAARKAGLSPRELRAEYTRLDGRDRADGRRYTVTVHRLGGRLMALMKGSPEEVLAMCDSVAERDGPAPLDQAVEAEVMRTNGDMAGRAMRVLALAERELPEGYASGELGRGYTFLGLIGLADPLRPTAAAAVEALHRAGIRTIMITGDQAATAAAVARELGLPRRGGRLHVLEASVLSSLEGEALRGVVHDVDVFARVPPEMKLAIVRALQADGEVVAMTGDGVNDGPALRAADVGVAMGQHGTELARELADVVLSTDDFSQMVDAVEEGRLVRANVRRVLHYLLSTNSSEVWVVAGAVAAGLPSPLSPLQLLWLNVVTDIAPGLGLAVEPRDPDLMRQPPRDPREAIIPRPLMRRILSESGVIALGALAAHGIGIARHGPGPAAQTMAFASLVGAQLLHVPLARAGSAPGTMGVRPPNRPLAVGVGFSALLQLAALFFPPLRAIVGGAALGLADLGIAALAALAPVSAIEMERRFRYRKLA